MIDYLNSLYIDDEMNLDEKVQFIENIRKSDDAFRQAIDLIAQERLLRCALALPSPNPVTRTGLKKILKIWWAAHFRSLTSAAAGLLAGLLLFILYPTPTPLPQTNRFVIFLPQARQVELSGTFTEWRRLPMQPVGRTGYWELNIPLTPGEHRYVFIINNDQRITDPTQPHREHDDFGGVNSICKIGNQV
jgi:hypothetical protein